MTEARCDAALRDASQERLVSRHEAEIFMGEVLATASASTSLVSRH